MEFVRDRRLVVIGAGVVLAGVVAGGATALAGVSPHYAIVAGLGIGAPALNLGRGGSTFDRERYFDAKGPRAVAVDAAFSGAMALAVGGVCVTVAVFLGLRSEPLLVAIAAATTVLGGSSSFVYRTVDYREVGPGPDGDDADTGGV